MVAILGIVMTILGRCLIFRYLDPEGVGVSIITDMFVPYVLGSIYLKRTSKQCW